MLRREKRAGLIFLAISFLGCWLCSEIIKSAEGLPIDDAYIFKRYALNLASGFGFSFNPGERSFGCSSFLWTFWLAVLVKVFGREHYYAIAQWSSIIFSCLAIFYLLRMVLLFTQSRWLTLGSAFLGWFCQVTFMNAVSGMESGLFSLLVMMTFYRFVVMERRGKWFGFRLGLYSGLAFLTRPEGIYFAIALSIIWAYKLIRGKKSVIISWISFLIGFGIFVLPYLIWMWVRFHQFIPYGFRAKIYSADSGIFLRPFRNKILDGLGFLWEGLNGMMSIWRITGWVILIFAVFFVIYSVIKFLLKPKDDSLVLISGWMFLPFVYGYMFPVSPHFGGYYQRYIASVYLVILLLGLGGLERVLRRIPFRNIVYLVLLIAVIIYCKPIAEGQFRSGKATYIKEVSLNEGLRRDAGIWLKERTPEGAKVLVGHTGLGVVGGESNRYVYDIGALINPDLLPYLEGTRSQTEKRWVKVLSYICDRGIDYYVSFANVSGIDPGKTVGFKEEARFGSEGEPKEPYEQIRIYRIERGMVCVEKK